MAEQTQSEKLEAQLTGLLNSPVNSWKPTHILVRHLLEACKEAGLRFVNMPIHYADDGIEEIKICSKNTGSR